MSDFESGTLPLVIASKDIQPRSKWKPLDPGSTIYGLELEKFGFEGTIEFTKLPTEAIISEFFRKADLVWAVGGVWYSMIPVCLFELGKDQAFALGRLFVFLDHSLTDTQLSVMAQIHFLIRRSFVVWMLLLSNIRWEQWC